jgi:hypothetical protein
MLTVFVQPSTLIYLPHHRTSHSVLTLNPGERIIVWAEYDQMLHRIDPTMHVTVM